MTNDLPPSILSFAVVAALVTTVGALVGHVLKELFLAKAIEKWRSNRALETIYRRYRDPIVLAAIELANRLDEIEREYPTDYLHSDCLHGPPIEPGHGTERDAYFARYKCQSTIYRMAALLGWLELYRQELVFLDAGTKTQARAREAVLQRFRGVLADGHLIAVHTDWQAWSDALIFREEQRAVGESMIVSPGAARVVMGYGQFVSLLETGGPDARWLQLVVNFFADPRDQRDFRRHRYSLLLKHLIELVRHFEPARLTERLRTAERRLPSQVPPAT